MHAVACQAIDIEHFLPIDKFKTKATARLTPRLPPQPSWRSLLPWCTLVLGLTKLVCTPPLKPPVWPQVGGFLRLMRESAKDPAGPGRIYTAGELEHEAGLERNANGGAPVPEALLKDMRDLRNKFPALQKKYAKFCFE